MTADIQEQNPANDGLRSLKTFRRSKDLEDFYRFINENGLRRQAHHALEFVTGRLSKPKKSKRGRKAKTVQ
ncbi:MAG: hypothetical protein K9K67_09400 [Bacteriovoracaceae bacterium]|nr:hypothetical protein [Bacteriovoracaceae bacterium]